MPYVFVDTTTKERHNLPDHGEIKIGRGNGNHINAPPIITDVDGSHCEVSVRDGGVYARDLGSRAGTYISEDRLASEFTELKAGSLLRIGRFFGLRLERGTA